MREHFAQRIALIVALSLMALTALAGAPGRAAAQNLEPVSVVVFPGGFNWPICENAPNNDPGVSQD